ncbi:MAG: hypothetical protein EOP84_19385 [Verrucomicrobiaceae bacterium]|nr:MAG: hypothetical protein EOP84_19385 [Verrucomicrobiaceae bacterium]
MLATWTRSLIFLASLGLVSACQEVVPPEKAPVLVPVKKKPAVVAPVVKKKPVVVAPVVTKPKTVDIDFGNDGGGGGSGGGGWQ